jgi:hypothetical protein
MLRQVLQRHQAVVGFFGQSEHDFGHPKGTPTLTVAITSIGV